ncbi:MAG: GAF domain-containing protein [bacterium]|jgi:transcriptional regulator of acetoin/glycerol metabolism|nr:GAF domain-containing protein [bacterium]
MGGAEPGKGQRTARGGERESRRAREEFLSGHDPSTQVRPEIAKSWMRSRMSGVLPDGDPLVPFRAVDRERRLLRIAQPILNRLADPVSETKMTILLADSRGQLLDRRTGDRQLLQGLDRLSIAPGFVFSEDTAGTNGVGTAVEERHPAWVVGSEHYMERFQWLTCVGVPVVHPVTGRTEGILDATCRHRDTTPLMLPFIQEAVRQIEQRLYEDASERDRALLEQFLAIARRATRPVVAVNEQTIITNLSAARLLEPTDHALLWEQVADTVSHRQETFREIHLSSGETATIRCHAPTEEDFTAGAVIELGVERPAGPRGGPARGSGPIAQLPGRGFVWQLTRAAAERASVDLPLLLRGETGVGKLTLARAVAEASSPGGECTVLDAAAVVLEGASTWLGHARRRLSNAGGTLVLRHLDALDRRAAAALGALLGEVGGRDAGPRIIGTLTLGGGSTHRSPLVDRFPEVIDVPPLRSRLEDIADLTSAMVRRHASVPPGPRCSPEVLRTFMRTEWPGNLAQLENLLRGILSRRTTGEIALTDLPNEYRGSLSRALTPMERAERDTILAALTQSRGNRKVAAQTLGISRSTLYRKLREYEIDDDRIPLGLA